MKEYYKPGYYWLIDVEGKSEPCEIIRNHVIMLYNEHCWPLSELEEGGYEIGERLPKQKKAQRVLNATDMRHTEEYQKAFKLLNEKNLARDIENAMESAN